MASTVDPQPDSDDVVRARLAEMRRLRREGDTAARSAVRHLRSLARALAGTPAARR